MRDAIGALEQYLAGQNAHLGSAPLTESFESVIVTELPLQGFAPAVERARRVVEYGGTVTLTLGDDDASASIVSVGPDAWRIDGPRDVISDEIAVQEPRGRWSTEDLMRFSPRSLDRATCGVKLDKNRWSDPVAASTGRRVWIGVRTAAFVHWMRQSTWEGAARLLFLHPAAVVLLADWTHPQVDAGPRLTIGDLGAQPIASSDGVAWPEPTEPSIARAMEVDVAPDPTEFPDGDLKRTVAGMAAATAAWMLGEVREGDAQSRVKVRPSRAGTTRWTLPPAPQVGHTAIPVVQLARWVTKDANATRLAVARRVAAERISDPFDDHADTPAETAAETAYQSAVSEHVQTALRTQLDLERSFEDVDAKVADIRDDIRGSVDQTVVRALTASLGIAVAALTVANVRGWPTVGAAEALAAYVLFTAWWVLRTLRADIANRFEPLSTVIRQRELALGRDASKAIEAWKTDLRKRVSWAQAALTVLAVAIAIGGAILGATLHRSSPQDRKQPIPPSPRLSDTRTP